MTDPLWNASDAAIVLGGICWLIGYVCGFALAVTLFWRKIRRPSSSVLRLLRWQVDDDAEHIRQLYQMNDRLARQLTNAEARNAELLLRLGAGKQVA